MSVILTTSQQVSQSPLNSSTSKHMFSFSKSKRFTHYPKGYCEQPFYALPERKSARATTMGIGTRNSFSNIGFSNTNPPPGTYDLPSDFSLGARKGFQFGVGRDAYTKVYTKGAAAVSISSPGPGSYIGSLSLTKKTSPQYTLKPRTPSQGNFSLFATIPGPGQYSLPSVITSKGVHSYARYKNSLAASFAPPSSVRFPNNPKLSPGPGAYFIPNTLGPTMLSRYKYSGSTNFLIGSRYTGSKPSSAASPGPGTYPIPSEFGQYSSKYSQDFETAELLRARRKPPTQ